VGKSIAEVELRRRLEVTVLAIHRDSQVLPNPGPTTQLLAHDALVFLGLPGRIIHLMELISGCEWRQEMGVDYETCSI